MPHVSRSMGSTGQRVWWRDPDGQLDPLLWIVVDRQTYHDVSTSFWLRLHSENGVESATVLSEDVSTGVPEALTSEHILFLDHLYVDQPSPYDVAEALRRGRPAHDIALRTVVCGWAGYHLRRQFPVLTFADTAAISMWWYDHADWDQWVGGYGA